MSCARGSLTLPSLGSMDTSTTPTTEPPSTAQSISEPAPRGAGVRLSRLATASSAHAEALRRRRVCARRLQPPAAPRLRLQPQQQPREGLEASVDPCERRAEQLHLLEEAAGERQARDGTDCSSSAVILVRELGGGKGERVLVEAVHQHIDRRGQIALLSQAEPHRPDRLARAGLRKGWFEIGDEDDTARRARAGRTAARLQRARAAVWQQR